MKCAYRASQQPFLPEQTGLRIGLRLAGCKRCTDVRTSGTSEPITHTITSTLCLYGVITCFHFSSLNDLEKLCQSRPYLYFILGLRYRTPALLKSFVVTDDEVNSKLRSCTLTCWTGKFLDYLVKLQAFLHIRSTLAWIHFDFVPTSTVQTQLATTATDLDIKLTQGETPTCIFTYFYVLPMTSILCEQKI